MSNIGNNHTSLAKRSIGLANQKNRAKIEKRIKEYIKGLKDTDFPNITDAAICAGISEKRLIAYEITTDEESNIRLLLEEIRDKNKSFLMRNGLYRKTDSRITGLLLEYEHGFKKDQNPNLSQTNIFNVSPELLAEAINISRSQKSAQIKES